jgi:hypothetical protein
MKGDEAREEHSRHLLRTCNILETLYQSSCDVMSREVDLPSHTYTTRQLARQLHINHPLRAPETGITNTPRVPPRCPLHETPSKPLYSSTHQNSSCLDQTSLAFCGVVEPSTTMLLRRGKTCDWHSHSTLALLHDLNALSRSTIAIKRDGSSRYREGFPLPACIDRETGQSTSIT